MKLIHSPHHHCHQRPIFHHRPSVLCVAVAVATAVSGDFHHPFPPISSQIHCCQRLNCLLLRCTASRLLQISKRFVWFCQPFVCVRKIEVVTNDVHCSTAAETFVLYALYCWVLPINVVFFLLCSFFKGFSRVIVSPDRLSVKERVGTYTLQ